MYIYVYIQICIYISLMTAYIYIYMCGWLMTASLNKRPKAPVIQQDGGKLIICCQSNILHIVLYLHMNELILKFRK